MKITAKNFIDDYITNPLAKELSLGEKVLATALSILLLPLAVLHIRSLILKCKNVTKIQRCDPATQKLADSVDQVSFKVLAQSKLPISQSKVPHIINTQFVQKYYAKQVPAMKEVTVPYIDPATGEKRARKWVSLTREEKIQVNNTGTREHNKLSPDTTDKRVDDWFFAGGGHSYIEGDAREHHGNDHSIRASIIAPVFAYLYQKYDQNADVSSDDLILSQLLAAGHDSGRQTEGPDVYDEASAHNTQNELKSLGITSQEHLDEVIAAIEHKDSDPDQNKRLIAKCVQCADSAEFARLYLKAPRQTELNFNNSRKFLDIFRELDARAEKLNPQDKQAAVLKNGHTFAEFTLELDTLRHEMNHFIYTTHSRQFRQNIANSGTSSYAGYIGVINKNDHPLMHTVLTKVGLLK